MRKYLFSIVIFILTSGYVVYLDNKKKKTFTQVAALFEKFCLENQKCVIKPTGWDCRGDGWCYDENKMAYQVNPQQTHFQLRWKIATGKSLLATGGVKEKVVMSKAFD